MEQRLFLCLKPGAEPTEENGAMGLRLGDRLRFARSAGQAAALRALAQGPQTLAAVSALLRVRDGPLSEEAETALQTAAFILEFDDYLDAGGDAPSMSNGD